jgi:hypothetical protein
MSKMTRMRTITPGITIAVPSMYLHLLPSGSTHNSHSVPISHMDVGRSFLVYRPG